MRRMVICSGLILLLVGMSNAQSKSMTGTVIDRSVGNSGRWAGITIKVGSKRFFVYTESVNVPTPKTVGRIDEVGRTVTVFYSRIENSPGYDGELRATKIIETRSPSAPTGDWASFWQAFGATVRKRDRIQLRQLMSPNFEWAGDGTVTAGEAITYIDQGIVPWQKIVKSVAGGVINCKTKDSSCWNFSGRQAKRTIKPNWLVFELGTDGQWKWVRLVGD